MHAIFDIPAFTTISGTSVLFSGYDTAINVISDVSVVHASTGAFSTVVSNLSLTPPGV